MKAALPICLASLATGTAIAKGKDSRHAISDDDFIRVDGLRLYDSKGSLHYLTGTVDNLTEQIRKLTYL
jgi:mannan endo-1,4-beta-mannosidase